jgi:hypothetical protein
MLYIKILKSVGKSMFNNAKKIITNFVVMVAFLLPVIVTRFFGAFRDDFSPFFNAFFKMPVYVYCFYAVVSLLFIFIKDSRIKMYGMFAAFVILMLVHYSCVCWLGC